MNNMDEYDCHCCELTTMPNWSYSYALALYKLSHLSSTDDEEEKLLGFRASEALKTAICSYPLIPKLLLEKNNINITGRSLQTDWPSVLSPLNELAEDQNTHERFRTGSLRELASAKEKIISIFVERNHKLWSGDDVVKWLFGCCKEVVSDDTIKIEVTNYPIALMRYSTLKLEDFQDSFPHIPDNALDPRLVDAAMNVRPNARRMLRMPNQRGGEVEGFNLDEIQGQRAAQQMRTLLGRGRDGMQIIDNDLPFAEIFWRSLMPWNRVDGVPPGRQ